MKQQDWTEQLRKRLDSHEETVPEGLWADIERRMNRRARIVALRRWAIGVAACGLLLIGGWQLTMTTDDRQLTTDDGLLGSAASLIEKQTTDDKTLVAQANEGTETAPMKQPVIATAGNVVPIPETVAMGSTETASLETKTTSSATQTASSEIQTGSSEIQTGSSTQETTKKSTEVPPASQNLTPSKTERVPRMKRRSLAPTLSLHTNSLMAYGGSTETEPLIMNKAYMGYASNSLARTAPIYLSNHEERSEHHMPFTVGLSIRLPLTDRFWIGTGLNYSRVTSTFTRQLGANMQVNEQRLHYIGLPVTANYSFWRKPRLQAYASTGAEAQYNIKTQVDLGHLDRDRMQFSLQGAAGVEYDVLPHMGVYVQPGLRYYLDNRSHVQNIFKDRPLQFDLQIGLRIH